MQSALPVKNMNKTKYRGLLVASTGIFAGALAVSAAVQVIQPPPSDFIDTEASTNVVFAPLQEDTRQYVVRFSGDFSPSNDLEVAFGGDANGDGDLSPEETEYRAGVDCGIRKEEVVVGSPSPTMESSILHCTTTTTDYDYPLTTTTNYNFPLRLTRNQQSSWNLIKVTRRGYFSTEPTVTLKPRKPGLYIIVK